MGKQEKGRGVQFRSESADLADPFNVNYMAHSEAPRLDGAGHSRDNSMQFVLQALKAVRLKRDKGYFLRSATIIERF